MNAHNEENDFALVPRSPGAIEKTAPGKKRILSSIAVDTLALVKKKQATKRRFRVLICSGEEAIVASWTVIIRGHLGEAYDVNVTDRNTGSEILEFIQQQPIDLVVAMVNNIIVPAADGNDRILKAVELLARLKSEYGIPVIAFSGFKPESFDLPEQLRLGGIDAFLWAPYDIGEALKALDGCLKTPGIRLQKPRKSRPLRIVVVDDEDWPLEMVERLIQNWFSEVTVLTFQNRDEAWQELSRADPDLLITDMNNDNTPQYLNFGMRFGMSGWKMLPLLAERKAKYPILVVSGSFLMEGVEDKARQCAGPDLNVSFLAKPFTTEQFNLELFKHFGPSKNFQLRLREGNQ